MTRTLTMAIAGALLLAAALITTPSARGQAGTQGASPVRKPAPAGDATGSLPTFDDAVADSTRGFSNTQGASGWQYGCAPAQTLATAADAPIPFHPLKRCEAGWWRPAAAPVPALSATIFRASPSFIAIRRWTPRAGGSVRLVGGLRKPSPDTDAEFRIIADGKQLWSRRLARTDTITHAFDVLALDLTEASAVDLCVIAAPGSPPVDVTVRLQIVSEPYASVWRADLPTGYPQTTEAERQAQRERGQKVLQQISDASAAGARRIVIPPGDYLFHANWSQASTLSGITNLDIDARGVTFWFEPPLVHAVLFENCRNVTVRGLQIDCTVPCWFQARVTAVDRQAGLIRAKPMDGYGPRNANGESETSGARALMFYDSAGEFINHRHSPGKWRLSDDGAELVCSEIGVSGIPAALAPGGYVVGTIRTGAALRSINCAGMRFEDVNIWSSPGIAVNEGGGEGGNVYLRLRATRRPHTNRLQAFGADVYHLAATDRGPVLDRCEAAYGADDVLNIHGDFGRVVQAAGDRQYYLQGVYQVGDTLEFRDATSLDLLGIAKAVTVKKTPEGPSIAINETYSARGEVLVQLDQPLRLPPLSLVVLDGKRSSQGWFVRNCWFHSDFQRTLINGSPGGLIDNTTLQNLGHGVCVQFETWGPWMEGPFARDLVIRNSRFLDSPPDGPPIYVSMHPPGGGTNVRQRSAMPVTNLTIAGNYFARTDNPPLCIHNVDGLSVSDNSIDRAPGVPVQRGLANSSDLNWLYLQDCANVHIRGNQTPGGP